MKLCCKVAGVILAAGFCIASADSVVADTFEQVTPDIPARGSSSPAFNPPERPSIANRDEVLVPALKGLILVSTPDGVRSDGTGFAGVELGSFDLLSEEETVSELHSFLGRPLSLTVLDELVKVIIGKYRAANRPFVDVIVPPQDITSGSVQILVLEFVAGEVRTEGKLRAPSEQLIAEIRTSRGKPLDVAELADDLDWLNRSMFREVELVLQRGEVFGETDLVLQVEERAPWRVYAGMDNTGSRATGRERYMIGGNFGDILFDEALLSYQYTSSRELITEGRAPFGLTGNRPAYSAHSFDYSLPIFNRDELSIFGFYAESRPNLGSIISSVGKSWQLSARYQLPVIRSGTMRHYLSAGVDFKRTNNNLGFGGTIVSNSNTDIAQAILAWSGDESDEWGRTSFGASVALSPGGLSAFNNDRDYQPSATAVGRTDARARFAVLRANLERSLHLPFDFTAHVRAHGQFSSTNLLPSEQILAGGSRTVRGFEENEAAGDHGIVGSLEMRSPSWSLLKNVIEAQDAARVYGFLDRGDVWLDGTLPGEVRQKTLMSTGVGLAYQLGTHLSVDVAHGWQLDGRNNNRAKGERTHFRLLVSF